MLKTRMIAPIFVALLSTSALANEFHCEAQGLDAYLVFDDGPGGLDHFELNYDGVTYTEWNADHRSNVVEARDGYTPDHQYLYDNDSLALQLRAKNGNAFVLHAISGIDQTSTLRGQISIEADGQSAALPLTCRLN